MQEREQFSTNSAFSEGWVVKCVCGAKKNDGRPMIECEECKVWQHTKCIFGKASKGVLPTYFVCADCRQKTVEKDTACKVRILRIVLWSDYCTASIIITAEHRRTSPLLLA